MKITSIILHYNRSKNVPLWIEGIKNQTVKSNIWVWDNSGDYPEGSGEDLLIRSSKNMRPQTRLMMAGFVQSKYVYNQDDDLAINDSTLFEQFIEVAEKYPNQMIGWNGRYTDSIKDWNKAYSFPGGGFCDAIDDNGICPDMINTGVSFYRTALINQVPINPYQNDTETMTEQDMIYGDDMWISHWVKEKRVMPFKLIDKYDWLDEGNTAVSKQSCHMEVRDRLMRRFWQ